MGDMRQAAKDLQSLADRMDGGSDPVAAINAAKRVMDKHGVRQALNNPPANLGTCNEGKRALVQMHTSFGKVLGGHRGLAVAGASGVLKDIAKACAQW